jgi:glycosyltransferase involved in cell wall biosynthesis
VFFSSDISVRGYDDQGFGVHVEWDTPLLEGYNYSFLPLMLATHGGGILSMAGAINYGIGPKLRTGTFDAVWVHGYNYLTNLEAIRVANSMRVPVLLRAESTLHDRPRSPMKLAIKKLFLKLLKPRISAVLAIGEENAQYWKQNFGQQFPLFPFYYAVNNEFFQRACAAPSCKREQLRAALELCPDRPVILFAAKLMARKRCSDLLEAFLKLSQTNGLEPLPYLLIVGDDQERATLESRANEARPGDIRFLGFRNQSELPGFYDLCDVFVLASVDEPLG